MLKNNYAQRITELLIFINLFWKTRNNL